MKDNLELKIIAKIKTDFPTKFGIPRQSGIIDNEALIVFEEEYRNEQALKGIEGFSHIWLIWKFSETETDSFKPTVRPPRLGGNKRMGVFATRSPFRPNPIGLSSVKLLGVEKTKEGLALRVSGADLMNNTPILDIKPYLPFTDCHPDASGGFAEEQINKNLQVVLSDELAQRIPNEKLEILKTVLSQDPRPHYIEDSDRVFGFNFMNYEIKFKVDNDTLTVTDITNL